MPYRKMSPLEKMRKAYVERRQKLVESYARQIYTECMRIRCTSSRHQSFIRIRESVRKQYTRLASSLHKMRINPKMFVNVVADCWKPDMLVPNRLGSSFALETYFCGLKKREEHFLLRGNSNFCRHKTPLDEIKAMIVSSHYTIQYLKNQSG